ncbi:MAG: tryptophan synthase subunit alpha, partial [Endomicrobiia bacterium]|nr:tryptophan synthase subunit alpha [Endomicrobiia bacterium]
TIQRSSQKALEKGVTTSKTFALARRLKHSGADIYLMSYLNPLLAFGSRNLKNASRVSGVAGFIIPDLTPESASALRRKGVELPDNIVYLAAPNTPSARLKKIAVASRGFVYAVVLLGVTGARKGKNNLPPARFIRSLRRLSPHTPVFAGFGVSSPSSAAELARYADGVIIGSAIMDIIENVPKSRAATAVASFVAACKKAISSIKTVNKRPKRF